MTRQTSRLERVLALTVLTASTGIGLGVEANIQPFNSQRTTDLSFSTYAKRAQEQYTPVLGYILAAWTYPGAKLGVAFHNATHEEFKQ